MEGKAGTVAFSGLAFLLVSDGVEETFTVLVSSLAFSPFDFLGNASEAGASVSATKRVSESLVGFVEPFVSNCGFVEAVGVGLAEALRACDGALFLR